MPPLLDWNRFRTSIGAIAAAELGRKVVIGGDVALRLLPQAVLTATDVTLPDTGDGMSARIASLRLEVGLFPLLAGRLVVHDLVLGSPAITLPWPLPNSIASPARPSLPHAFAAHVENGTLRAGGAAITGINAAIHGGPAPTDSPGTGPATFGAEGFASLGGQRWRFTTALGAPDADGVSAVDLAVQGQGPARDTGGVIEGTLAEGVLQGHLHAAGPDLSLLMPASPLAWRAEAPFTASGERIESAALTLSLGGAPASAAFTLQLASPRRLDAHLTAAALDLDGWSRLLGGTVAGFTPPAIPMRLDVAADSGSLLGGTLGPISGTLDFDGSTASVENLQAMLPGGARLHISGRIEAGAKLTLHGPATLDAPDLHATLAWLRPLAPFLFAALPDQALRSASLTGTARLSPGRLSVQNLSGNLDNAPLSGTVDLALGAHPKLSARAHFDHLSIDPWLTGLKLHPGIKLAAAVKPFTATETSLRISAATASWHGRTFTDVLLDAATGAGGLKLNQATATTPDFTIALSGAIAPDGAVAGVHLHGATPDLARFAAGLPESWRAPAIPWHTPARLTASAEGPPGALTLQMRAESGDLTLEADQRRNTISGEADTTLTLRHPAAHQLLETCGYAGTESWLGAGSMALLAHLHTAPGFAGISDVAVDAAALHLHGHGTVTYAGAAPALSLALNADELPLPTPDQLQTAGVPPLSLPSGWQLSAELHASIVETGLRPAAQDLSASLTAAQNNVLVELHQATVAGGTLSAQFAADATQQPALSALQAQLSKATIAGAFTGWPIDLTSGNADLGLDLASSGNDWPATLGKASGAAHLSLRDATLSGLSLPHLSQAIARRPPPPRASLLDALTTGESAGLSGTADIAIDHGQATLAHAGLTSPEGSLSITGKLGLADRKVDIAIAVTPASAGNAPASITLSGTGTNLKSTLDLGKLSPPPQKPPKHPKHRA